MSRGIDRSDTIRRHRVVGPTDKKDVAPALESVRHVPCRTVYKGGPVRPFEAIFRRRRRTRAIRAAIHRYDPHTAALDLARRQVRR